MKLHAISAHALGIRLQTRGQAWLEAAKARKHLPLKRAPLLSRRRYIKQRRPRHTHSVRYSQNKCPMPRYTALWLVGNGCAHHFARSQREQGYDIHCKEKSYCKFSTERLELET